MVRLIIDNQQIKGNASGQINDTLNEINKMEFLIPKTTLLEQQIFAVESIVQVNTHQKYYEFIIVADGQDDMNSVKYTCVGIEEVAFGDYIDIDQLNNTTSKTQRTGNYVQVSFSDFIDDLLPSGWSFQTSISDIIDFRVNSGMTKWNAISRCCNENGYELDIDYDNKKLLIEIEIGRQGFDNINEKIDFKGMPVRTNERPKAKRVIVEGKGDGDLKVVATATDLGFNPSIHKAYRISEPNIFTVQEAQKRADIELERLKQNITHFTIPQLAERKVGLYKLGDTIFLNAPSMNLVEKELKIVKKIISFEGNEEDERLEVTNANYARAIKSYGQKVNEQLQRIQDQVSSMQGSGNTLNWSSSINANFSFPLKTYFNIPEKYIENKQGGFSILDFEVDYEISEFKESAGSASEDFVAPDFRTTSTTENHNHDVIDNGHNHFIQSQTSQSSNIMSVGSGTLLPSANPLITTQWSEVAKINPNGTLFGTGAYLITFNIIIQILGASGQKLFIRIERSGNPLTVIYQKQVFSETNAGMRFADSFTYINNDESGAVYYLDLQTNTGNVTLRNESSNFRFEAVAINRSHSHTINSITSNQGNANTDEQNRELGLFGGVQDHKHNVQIGADLGEASNINSTGASLFLDYWNGLNWIQKHSITNISGRIGQNIDISNNGQFPDEAGNWRLRTRPNSSTPDYVQSVIRLRHNLNN